MSVLVEKYKELMVNFEKGQLIAVDIGLSAVKMASLSQPKKGQFRLDKYMSVPLSEASIIEDEIQKPEEIIDAIKLILSKKKITKKIACLGMDGPNTITKRLQVPDGAMDEVEDNILWESEQYIPFGAEDAEIGFSIIGKIEHDDVVDAVVGAAKIDVVEKYIDYLSEAGLVVKVVDLNMFSIVNVFEYIYKDNIEEISEQGAIIIDFGAQHTSVIVYKNGGPLLTKEINIGGVLVTEEIQRTMGVSYEEAEDLKINGDENGNLPEDIIPLIENHTIKLLEELKKVLNFYIAAGSSELVGNCMITGGSSSLPGLVESLQGLVDLEIEVMNPFDVIDSKENLDENELNFVARTGIVAMGLAMRSV